jgi:replication factor C subunit 1
MRLRASGDRHEIRQQYLPTLWAKLVRPLNIHGQDEVDSVIDLMDSYFLTKDDWDAIVELGVGPMDEGNVKLETKTKATFTRLYNQRSHPMPFMKASNVVAPKRASKEKPDLEEAIDESDDGEELVGGDEVGEDEEEALDLKKDKYVKVPKKKTAGAKKGKREKGDEEESEGEKPKKGRGRAKGKAKT